MGLKPITVAQLNNYVGRVIGTDPLLGNVSVIGEISNIKFHSSGHVYFSLKDEHSRINCFLPSYNLDNVTFSMENGMEVIAYGHIFVYERGGYYSLNTKAVELSGTGQLFTLFENLKGKLESEGLFSTEQKKPLPLFPKRVAVVTSETGAAVRDILRTIQNKNDIVNILVYPVLVQGPSASEDIAKAICDINENHGDIDVIITGRGGGSMEELWAFNEEIVARSIFDSKIPVISAVGHETDFTIADFVSDYRAATPTAAAEAAVPDTRELRETLKTLKKDVRDSMDMHIKAKKAVLDSLNPVAFAQYLKTRISFEQLHADRLIETMQEGVLRKILYLKNRVEQLHEVIETSNPELIIERGYAVLTDERGAMINSLHSLNINQDICITMKQGRINAKITEILENTGDNTDGKEQ